MAKFNSLTEGQTRPQILWERAYGGPEDDGGSAIISSGDGGFLVVGFTENLSAGDDDVYILKIDADGNRIWERTYGGPEDENVYSIVVSGDGGFVGAGYTRSFGAGDMDLYALKIDADGGKIWERAYGNPRHQSALRIVRDDGGFILLGYDNPLRGGRLDFHVLRIDSDGNKTWENDYGRSQDEIANDAVSISGNGSLLVGFSNSTTDGTMDVFLVRIDGDGNELWNKTYGGSLGDVARCLARPRMGVS